MKLKALLYSLVAIMAISCNDDPEGNTLNGSWKLTNATVADGPSLKYNMGDVVWTFNENSKMLYIKNNTVSRGPENLFSGLPTGTYDYSVIIKGNKSHLFVEGIEQGAFANTGANLVISMATEGDNNLTKVFKR